MENCLLILSILPVFLCCKSSNLDDSELNFNPYKKNDVLIFESNLGERDSLRIRQVINMKNNAAQMTLNPDKLVTLLVEADYSEAYLTIDNYFEPVEIHILEINKVNKEPALVQFNLDLSEAVFYPKYNQKIEDVLKQTKYKMKIGGKKYDDIVIIKPESNEYASREHFISKIYWSLKYGYVRYDLLNGKKWELVN
ncbi:hypothetical protein [Fluviicola taffensis]|uniref:Uncharacterized protein n=1 Tax=Fluviicola taffensis (strain DSM 16823 / NCIMB 13979 / RW262) TaxID=755732 RepID=F2IEU0_FLUTR|nr:hypothetical protein [Fluviicola taffensis]AEA45657.1 hypothetical protein Fluta_3689 [Fluviicola taffensis DSM 16823]